MSWILIRKIRPGRRVLAFFLLFMLFLGSPGSVLAAESQDETPVAARLAAGRQHSALIDYAGRLYLWGDNTYGQLGLTDTDYSDFPRQVNIPGQAAEISLGAEHTLVLTTDGRVYAFGRNSFGQLGNQTTQSSAKPVLVVNLPKITAISAGAYHSLALAEDGSIWAWGDNTLSQVCDAVGDPIMDAAGKQIGNRYSSPVKIVQSGGAALSAGGFFSLYLDTEGLLFAWGDNSRGQLGDSTTQTRGTPAQVAGLEPIALIAAGYEHALAVCRVDDADNLYSWGDDSLGQLGNGTADDGFYRTTPERVDVSGDSNPANDRITLLAAGYTMSVAAIPLANLDGTFNYERNSLLTWGNNTYGQLAQDGTADQNKPRLISGFFNGYEGDDFLPFDALAAGGFHLLVLSNKGFLAAVGLGGCGQLGNLSITNRSQLTPISIVDRIRPGWLEDSRMSVTMGADQQLTIRWPAAQDNISVTGYRIVISWSDGTSQVIEAGNRQDWTMNWDQPAPAGEISVYAYDQVSADAPLQSLSRLVHVILPETTDGSEPDPFEYFDQLQSSLFLNLTIPHHWRPDTKEPVQPLEVPWDVTAYYGAAAIPEPPNDDLLAIMALIAVLMPVLYGFTRLIYRFRQSCGKESK